MGTFFLPGLRLLQQREREHSTYLGLSLAIAKRQVPKIRPVAGRPNLLWAMQWCLYLNGGRKTEKRRIKCLDTGKSYEMQISVFMNTVELKHSLATPLCIMYGRFHSTMAELRSYNKEQWPTKPNIFLALYRKCLPGLEPSRAGWLPRTQTLSRSTLHPLFCLLRWCQAIYSFPRLLCEVAVGVARNREGSEVNQILGLKKKRIKWFCYGKCSQFFKYALQPSKLGR